MAYLGTQKHNFANITASNYSITSTSFVAIDTTNLRKSITPSTTNSKVFIVFMCGCQNTANVSYFRIVRDPTGTPVEIAYLPFRSGGWDSFAIMAIDSPASTSQQTYEIQARVASGTLEIGGGAYSVHLLVQELRTV